MSLWNSMRPVVNMFKPCTDNGLFVLKSVLQAVIGSDVEGKTTVKTFHAKPLLPF